MDIVEKDDCKSKVERMRLIMIILSKSPNSREFLKELKETKVSFKRIISSYFDSTYNPRIVSSNAANVIAIGAINETPLLAGRFKRR